MGDPARGGAVFGVVREGGSIVGTMNKMDAGELESEVKDYRKHPDKCQVVRKMTAEWVGGTRARLSSGTNQMFVGGDGEFGAMSVALASLLACEVDLIATRATLQGIELERLSLEGSGEFNLARYMGVAENPAPGFRRIVYTVRIKSKNATPEQLRDLVKLCETASPVGDSLARPVPLSFRVVVD